MGLKVKLLDPNAKAPTVAHPGEDLGYDLYALEDVVLVAGANPLKVRTGVAVAAYKENVHTVLRSNPYDLAAKLREEFVIEREPCGLLIRDRSSMASKGVLTHGGVIDAGYRGEIIVLMSFVDDTHGYAGFAIKAGDKIAQAIPVPVLTREVEVVDELTSASRGERGFGSSGSR